MVPLCDTLLLPGLWKPGKSCRGSTPGHPQGFVLRQGASLWADSGDWALRAAWRAAGLVFVCLGTDAWVLQAVGALHEAVDGQRLCWRVN